MVKNDNKVMALKRTEMIQIQKKGQQEKKDIIFTFLLKVKIYFKGKL